MTAGLEGEVDDGGGAADGCGAGAGEVIVGGRGAAEGHVEVGVDVDAAGHQEEAGGVYEGVAGGVNVRSYGGDLFAFDEDVGLLGRVCVDDGGVLDEDAHGACFRNFLKYKIAQGLGWCRKGEFTYNRRLVMPLSRRCLAEFFGTFWLVFGGCGSAVLAAGFPALGIGFVGVSLAFGLTVLTMAYTLGHISGCHLNPAVTIGLVTGKRFPAKDAVPYIVAQVVGAIAGAGVLYAIASGKAGFSTAGGFASNGYGLHSPGGYGMVACIVAEVVLTMFFLLVIMGSTDKRVPSGFAPIAIGLGLTLIHLISIPVTNTSVNPARSTGPALFVGGWAVKQLWLFWVAPLVGGALGGVVYEAVFSEYDEKPVRGGEEHDVANVPRPA